MSKTIRFGIVAGERSGDILGAGLMAALKARYPGAHFIGIGGADMEAQGLRSLVPMERLSVMGFVEPLGRLPELLLIKADLERRLISNPPALFIGIDSPDFNLRVETRLREQGIRTVHYVSPSVWAYRKKRIFKIKKAVDLMLTLFPFETDIYRQHEIPVKCVGHPLADTIDFEDRKLEHRQKFDLAAQDQVVTLMPGSRSGEIKRLAPAFIGAALEAMQYCPQLKFLIPCSSADTRLQLKDMLRGANVFSSAQFQLVDDSHAAISAADLVLMASGTATLEAMLLRRPMIVCYKLATITYLIASRMVKIPYVALPNLLAGKKLVPEYLQNNVKVRVLRNELVRFFQAGNQEGKQGGENLQPLLAEFDKLHRQLRLDASKQAAAAIADMIDKESD